MVGGVVDGASVDDGGAVVDGGETVVVVLIGSCTPRSLQPGSPQPMTAAPTSVSAAARPRPKRVLAVPVATSYPRPNMPATAFQSASP